MGRLWQRGQELWQRGQGKVRNWQNRFWLWLYILAKKHLPGGYMDVAWDTFVQERITALGHSHGEEFVTWVFSDLYNSEDGQGRDYRLEKREIRDAR